MRSIVHIGITVALFLAAGTAHAQMDLGDVQRENLGPAINSPSIEILPIVSPDGSTLYFDRKNDVANVGGPSDLDDIYYAARLPDGSWSPAQNIGAPLNTPGSDVLYWISPDGDAALVHHGAVVKGKTVGMAIARRKDGRWTKPVAIRIDGVATLGESYYAQITPDGRHLLLSYAPDAKRPSDLEIFVCDAIGQDLLRWGAPRTLGPMINSSSFDGAPFLASDERTLYFATDGRGGMGSSDLFVARRLDSGWTNWSEPMNLGGAVNTPRFDASLSIPADGQHLYVSGAGFIDEQSFGKADIFRIPLPKQFRPAVVLTVNGRLLAGSRGVSGLVRAERVGDAREVASTVSDASGRFRLTLPTGTEYRLTGGADGYVEGSAVVDGRDVTVPRLVDATIRLERGAESAGRDEEPQEIGIYFASGSAELGARAIAGLEKALATIRRDQGTGIVTNVVVIGHTDDVGTDDSNVELSRRRAEAARGWLLERGVDASMVTVEAHGESKPVASNATARGRAQNRRVEVQYVVERSVETVPRR
jgi:OmpA-OmpF porin, OOP family